MDGIKIEVIGNIAKVTAKPDRITSGTVGLPIEFTFDSEWTELDKAAVFRAGKTSVVTDNLTNTTVVPWEVLEKPNLRLSIGVYGVNKDGTVAIPTIWANVSVIKAGAVPDGEPDTDPTLPVYQKLLNDMDEMQKTVGSVSQELNAVEDKCQELDGKIDTYRKLTVYFGAEITPEMVDEYRNAYLNGARLVGVENGETSVREYLCIGITNRSLYFQRTEANLITTVILSEYGSVSTYSHLMATSSQLSDVITAVEKKAEIEDTTVGADAWSSKNIVDKLCPAFEESGSVVTCEPVEGYPLEVVTTAREGVDSVSSLELHICGKNLFDFQSGVYEISFTGTDGNPRSYKGYAINLPAGTYTLHAEGTPSGQEYIYGALCDGDNKFKTGCNIVLGNNFATRTVTIESGDTLYVYNGISQTANINAGNQAFAKYNIQLEVGGTATAYEEYRGEVLTVDFISICEPFESSATYDWNTGIFMAGTGDYFQHDPDTGAFNLISDIDSYEKLIVRNFPADAGVDTFYCNAGITTVKGRKDPIALFDKLTNAILAMGSNV